MLYLWCNRKPTTNMKDPTQQEMFEFLSNKFENAGIDGIIDNILISSYWFAYNFHDGQTSDLYSALCNSFYSPSILANNIEDEYDSIVFAMYNALIEKFIGEDYDQFLLDENNIPY